MLLMPIVHALAAEEHGGIHQNANCDLACMAPKTRHAPVRLGA